MTTSIKLPFVTLLLLISFASVNAVIFTPALPEIATYFGVSADTAGQTIAWFLIGYTFGQLIYGPIANRFGKKPALYGGILLQIISSLVCVASGAIHAYWLLILGRFFLALGSAVGLKMTFTLVHECYEPKKASKTVSYLMLAFAITPGLGVALGGWLTQYFSWVSCFYASAIYGIILLTLVTSLPETTKILDRNALRFKHLVKDYRQQFKNKRLITGGLLIGSTSSVIYLFATGSPFIAISFYKMTSAEYGMANLIPPIGLILGSLIGAPLTQRFPLTTIIKSGITITLLGVLFMVISIIIGLPVLANLFLATLIIYCGLCLIMPNASALAMSQVHDKSHGSSVMSFLNVGCATLSVFGCALFPISIWLLPALNLFLCVAMIGFFIWLKQEPSISTPLKKGNL